LKHRRQLEELRAAADSSVKGKLLNRWFHCHSLFNALHCCSTELEKLQNEKRKMLMEHETMKLKSQDDEFQSELRER
jgi:STE20-like kinase